MVAAPDTSFGEQLRTLRRAAGLSQEALADRAGLSADAVAALERGRRRRPRADTVHALADALGLDDATVEKLKASTRGGCERVALPERVRPMIGRDDERQQLLRTLTGPARAVTLTGPGGVGKTRLALSVAHQLAATGDHDVHWVWLGPVSDPAAVASAVAGSVGARDASGPDPVEAVLNRLADRPAVLVLDNCEHVVDAAGRFTAELVSRTDRLRVLATSREALRVPGEVVRPVPPLGIPSAGSDPPAAQLPSWPATRLFLDRARDVAPDFAPDDATAAAIARVCRRLSGLPLAIELAAARMNAMTVEQLAEELDASLRTLTAGTCAAPDRHRTLDAAIGWSYDLLDPDERTVLARLSVAAGGWTLAAAQQFAAGDGIDPDDMLAVVTRLVAKSLVVLRSRDGLGRYAILRVIRLYAAERLAATGEAPAVRERHARYYAALAQRAAAGLRGPDQPSWLKQLDVEVNNLRAALEYWREAGAADDGLRMATALWRYAYLRGRYAEGRAVLDATLRVADTAPAADPTLRAGALVAAGTLAYLQCEYQVGAARVRRGLALYREAGECAAVAAALQRLGSISRELGDYPEAVARHEEGVALSRAAGDRTGVAAGFNYLGFVAWLRGNPERTEQLAAEALDQFRDSPEPEGLAWTLLNLGISARYRGALREADRRLHESLDLCDQLGYAEGTAWCLDQLGALARDRGEYRPACDLQQESLAMHAQLGDRWRAASVLEGLAVTAARLGTHEAAARLAGAGEALRRSIGTPRPPCDRAEYEAAMQVVRAALGEEEYAAQARAVDPQRLLARLGETGDLDAALGLPGDARLIATAGARPSGGGRS